MPVNLKETLAWKTAAGDASAMLDELQANILKGHVRDHLRALFVTFDSADAGKALLRWLAPRVKSARTHLEEVEAFSDRQVPGTVYWGVGLSAAGYRALEISVDDRWDPSFAVGMRAQQERLADPPSSEWEEPYRTPIHAVVIIGDGSSKPVDEAASTFMAALPAGARVVVEEVGLGRKNPNGDGIEHFGYVDGRSQPLFLDEDINAERSRSDGATNWDPTFPLAMVVTPDPLAADPATQYGSYFVFRKLEQNVRAFKLAERALAEKLGLGRDDAERAGAMLIGRFEDGTPLAVQSGDGMHHPVPNDFTYASDADGAKCPLHAHIRKTNPRGSGGFEAADIVFDGDRVAGGERSHLMARRGQTYGDRYDDPNDERVAPESRPSGGVGLLFMAFNTILSNQFEFTQGNWANFPQFPVSHGHPAAGVDPIIGQGPREAPMHCHPVWGGPIEADAPVIEPVVTMKVGEYFFMPSRSWLSSI